MHRIKLLIVAIVGIAITSCDRSTSYTLAEAKRIPVAEDKHVFSDLPSRVQLVNDSMLAMLSEGQHLGVYSIRTGKCFSSLNNNMLDADSLLALYMKRSSKKYTRKSDGSMEAMQLTGFEYANGKYYLFADVPVLESYDDAANFMKEQSDIVSNNPKLQELMSSRNDLSFSVQTSISFLVVAGNDLKPVSAFPLYPEIPQMDKRYLFPMKGFHVSGNRVIVPVNHNIIIGFSDTVAVGKAVGDLTLLTSWIMQGDSLAYEKDVLTNHVLNVSSMTTEDYGFANYNFHESDSGLVFSNSIGIYHLDGKPFFHYTPASPKERIGNFNANSDRLVYISQPGSAYHSPLSQTVNVVDRESSKLVLRQEIGNSKPADIDIHDNTIVQVQQGKDHYYIVTYVLEEK